MTATVSRWYTVQEAADILGVYNSSIYRWIRSGVLTGARRALHKGEKEQVLVTSQSVQTISQTPELVLSKMALHQRGKAKKGRNRRIRPKGTRRHDRIIMEIPGPIVCCPHGHEIVKGYARNENDPGRYCLIGEREGTIAEGVTCKGYVLAWRKHEEPEPRETFWLPDFKVQRNIGAGHSQGGHGE